MFKWQRHYDLTSSHETIFLSRAKPIKRLFCILRFIPPCHLRVLINPQHLNKDFYGTSILNFSDCHDCTNTGRTCAFMTFDYVWCDSLTRPFLVNRLASPACYLCRDQRLVSVGNLFQIRHCWLAYLDKIQLWEVENVSGTLDSGAMTGVKCRRNSTLHILTIKTIEDSRCVSCVILKIAFILSMLHLIFFCNIPFYS